MARRLGCFFIFVFLFIHTTSSRSAMGTEMADSVSWLVGLDRSEWCWMSTELVFGNFRRCSPVVEQIGWGTTKSRLEVFSSSTLSIKL